MSSACSHAHQSLCQLPPSTWCAAVAVPHRNPSGNDAAATTGILTHSWRMSVLAEILAAKRDEVTLLHQPQTRDAIHAAALAAAPPATSPPRSGAATASPSSPS